MTWMQALQLIVMALSAIAATIGVTVTVRGVVRTGAEGGGVLKQEVQSLKDRVGSMEGDVRELRTGQTTMLVELAKIPSQTNVKQAIDGLARRVGMIPPTDA